MHTYTAARILKDPAAITLWTVAVLAGLTYASHFLGPASGWLDRVVAMSSESTPPAAPDGTGPADPAATLPLPDGDEPPPDDDGPHASAIRPPKTASHLIAVRDDFGTKLSNLSRRNDRSYFKTMSVSQEAGKLILHLKCDESFRELTEDERLRVLQAIGMQWGNQGSSFEFVRAKRDAVVRLYSPAGDAIVGTANGTLGSAWLE